MADVTSSPRQMSPLEIAPEPPAGATIACPFCLEEIKAGASLCKHCGSTLSPIYRLTLAHAALEARLAALEADLATARRSLRNAGAGSEKTTEVEEAPRSTGWPHMFDNLFLGLAALLIAHWLASTVPHGQQSLYRFVALGVALPF